MEKLNFNDYSFRIKEVDSKRFIFDEIRRKFVVLQPEEWVRQHVIRYLIQEKGYPISLINVEKELKINDISKRYDIVVFSKNGDILLTVECKAPQVQITQKTFDQIARYNLVLKSDFLMITNGLNHYFCTVDYVQKKYIFLKDLPAYSEIKG
ncbi:MULTISPECIES: type I restriction enzyme HsdR N-terminal domain-containing protein [Capnocytophaga]|uniref:Restriction endonuclease subunit R n=1 Tax=Capnocytophaga canis TaxID=1848903 RepID=A0A0B7HWX3_9FLAO|nr:MULTISPECIES: type I restriction enzyme HsdR N-terminal domain-containing protein [Capnocytophaga]ATA73612.1 restriction endonuclease subunit R [Capnocytophaga sp. H4358]ATA75754.1 restriction endonuclease subunit R [Capnocytophaga sp. H2931]RIY36667.1 restriction endonuclease subunit R [Capnocytophaga canis]CEN43870.1 Type I restriction enzyme R protein N-terminal domain protein [Capnocytophaga canis]GIM60269.1 restriction endonuclease subunit R [Capnocytophaga canis]